MSPFALFGNSRLGKNYCGMQEIPCPTGHGQQMNIPQDAQKVRPARPQQAKQAEVEVKVERRSDSCNLSLGLSLNLSESWRTFSASC
jgi:hypothetical protein